MTSFIRILCLFGGACLLAVAGRAQPPAARPDSLLGVLRQATADTTRVRLLLQLSGSYIPSNLAQAQVYAQQALNLVRQQQLTVLYPKALIGMGRALHAQRNTREALRYYHRALRLARLSNQPRPEAHCYSMIGKIRTELGRPRDAQRAFQAALDLHRQLGNDLGMVQAYNNLGFSYDQQGQFAPALQSFLKALKLVERHPDEAQFGPFGLSILRNISAFYSVQQNDSLAIAYLRRAQRLLRRHPDRQVELSVLVALGASYFNLKRDSVALRYFTAALQLQRQLGEQAPPRESADVYYTMGEVNSRRKQYPKALMYLRRAAELYQRVGHSEQYISVLSAMATVYSKQLRHEPAYATARQALALAERAGYPHLIEGGYATLAEVSAAAGHHDEAFRYQTRYQAIHDSLFNQDKAQQLADLQTRYETQKKEAQISLLQRNTTLQQRARNLLIGGLAVAALLGAASYRRYRLERRARRQLQAKELELAARNEELTATQQQLHQSLDEKEVLLKEVHHRVKNNLQVIASRLALQALEQRANPAVTAALRDGQNWVKSISLIHEMLYQSDDLASVEFQPFLEQLVAQLGRAFAGGGAGTVACTVHAPGVRLSTGTAVPLGLVINELLSNAYKHAFAGGRDGHVAIELARAGAGYRLRVRDDGAGLPADFSLDTTASLGLRLVRSLARQLDGTLTVTRLPVGTEFSLIFQEIVEPAAAA